MKEEPLEMFILLKKRLVIISALLLPLILISFIAWVGPGQYLHHQLHKWSMPSFNECCCANEEHSECAWNDHFGHAWSAHRSIPVVGFYILIVSSLLFPVLISRCIKRPKQ